MSQLFLFLSLNFTEFASPALLVFFLNATRWNLIKQYREHGVSWIYADTFKCRMTLCAYIEKHEHFSLQTFTEVPQKSFYDEELCF